MPAKSIKIFISVSILVSIDYLSKVFIKTHFFPFTKINIINNFLNLVYVKNKGVAFGFLSTLPDYLRKPFLIWIPFVTCIVMFLYILFSKNNSKISVIGFTLIIAGAVGNLIDREFYGYVVDFIDVYYRNFHWPAFNLADSYISVGIFFIFMDTFINKKN